MHHRHYARFGKTGRLLAVPHGKLSFWMATGKDVVTTAVFANGLIG